MPTYQYSRSTTSRAHGGDHDHEHGCDGQGHRSTKDSPDDSVQKIASFLSLSDMASIASVFGLDNTAAVEESWPPAVGTPYMWDSYQSSPPDLVSLNHHHQQQHQDDEWNRSWTGNTEYAHFIDESDCFVGETHPQLQLQHQHQHLHQHDHHDSRQGRPRAQGHTHKERNTWAQEQLAAAVFSHPDPLRNYCVDAFVAAKAVRTNKQQTTRSKVLKRQTSPETMIEPYNDNEDSEYDDDYDFEDEDEDEPHRILFISAVLDRIFNNVPLNVLLDVFDGVSEVSLDTSLAVVRITGMTIQGVTNGAVHVVGTVWNGVIHFNPLALVQVVITRPFNAVGKTTEVMVSGIQSAATGVGSASSMAFYRLSAKTVSSSSLAQQGALRGRNRLGSPKLNKKLLRKLSSMHLAASVVAYSELADDAAGLSRQAKSRVQRMMHYDVSLRPFVATVKLPANSNTTTTTTTSSNNNNNNINSNDNNRADETKRSNLHNALQQDSRLSSSNSRLELPDTEPSSACSTPGSPFMCTPQSFPPTPTSRRLVLARGARFSDDVVFLARDQLRVHGALGSEDERTREMALALTQGRRLAVFDADDASEGVDLSCGQHVATKVGNMLYCSTRSMVPILRNCFVYFEMTELPKRSPSLFPQGSMATMSVGVSTKEMPPNTLVGAWKGSVGLCSTGQMLTAGQWCSPVDSSITVKGEQPTTVGCLVCLDDGSAFETWDGVIVTAAVTFNVNQKIVSAPMTAVPLAASTSSKGETTVSPVGSPAEISGKSSPPPTQIGPVPPSFTVPLLVPAEEELFPTVTLHSPGTAVMCRFSAGDVLASSKAIIGAPPGVTVYAVDGSVIFSPEDA